MGAIQGTISLLEENVCNRRIKGDHIPLAARVFARVDVWGALTSTRPQREAWPVSQVMACIREQSAKQFDPDIVRIFLDDTVMRKITRPQIKQNRKSQLPGSLVYKGLKFWHRLIAQLIHKG